MIKTLFWDNDGVLVDTEKLYYEATKRILGQEGVILTKELFVDNILKLSLGVWFLLEDKGYSEKQISELRKKRNGLYTELLQKNELLIPGVKETVKKLSQRYGMAIVTSSHRDHFETIHAKTDIIDYFDFYLTREQYKNSKPDPEPYLTALKRSGATPDEVLVIEDSERGLKSAVSAGLNCLIIRNELSANSNFTSALKVLNSVRELSDYLYMEHS
jgi:HAD superfamily hydrolase (TIGR01509 family)